MSISLQSVFLLKLVGHAWQYGWVHFLLSPFLRFPSYILYVLIVLFILQSKSAINGQTSTGTSTEAQVNHPLIQETRPLVSLRAVGQERRGGQIRGIERLRAVILSLAMSGERSMIVMDENGNLGNGKKGELRLQKWMAWRRCRCSHQLC